MRPAATVENDGTGRIRGGGLAEWRPALAGDGFLGDIKGLIGHPDGLGTPSCLRRVPASFIRWCASHATGASVVDLTFAQVLPRVLQANVKSKTTLESDICWCPFGHDIRKRTCRDLVRMSGPGHQTPIHKAKTGFFEQITLNLRELQRE